MVASHAIPKYWLYVNLLFMFFHRLILLLDKDTLRLFAENPRVQCTLHSYYFASVYQFLTYCWFCQVLSLTPTVP